jgi:uncharacterized protein (DUF2235 family)
MSGEYATAIGWAESTINRMPRWYYGHFILVARLEAMGRHDEATRACKTCRDVLPDAALSDLDRVPLKDLAKMEELCARLRQIGFLSCAN